MEKGILVTGLCTLHWGRLQYGNVGNYYIVEPLFRLLHKYFPDSCIYTTFQMDDVFIKREDIRVLPMDLYYSWSESDVERAIQDVETAKKIAEDKKGDILKSEYIEALEKCEIVINVSGDMWGDNAEHVGKDRFYVDCLKMKAAQLLNKKTILYAVTPGAFKSVKEFALAKDVFENFDKVFIREKVSMGNLEKWGMSTEKVTYAPCPSFLFEANDDGRSKWTEYIKEAHDSGFEVIGMTFGGFNMPKGPYDMWPREDAQYEHFLRLAEHVLHKENTKIMLFSHTNGFDLPPYFRLKNGRDFVILQQFSTLLKDRNSDVSERICLVEEPLLPYDLKGLIGKLDMLITGRVHASVAATSQMVPTVFVEYDRRVIYSDKMSGFSEQMGLEAYVCTPDNLEQMIRVTEACMQNKELIEKQLRVEIPKLQKLAEDAIKELKDV